MLKQGGKMYRYGEENRQIIAAARKVRELRTEIDNRLRLEPLQQSANGDDGCIAGEIDFDRLLQK